MRIAQVAPLYESVPPALYGGTERVVSYLTEELVNQGHDVTLFASGDSATDARLISPCERSLRLSRTPDQLLPHIIMIDQVCELAEEFDVVHFHTDYLHYATTRRCGFVHLTTLHGRLDMPQLPDLYRHFNDVPLVSISNSQRRPLRGANWVGTVYHGLPDDLYSFTAKPNAEPYLAFVGRMSREKRVDRAIKIALACGIELRIAAKVDPADVEYYERYIEPLIDEPGIEFIGEINDIEKNDFLGNAMALLFPIDWPEPFGLTMIEAMACGTPVIAWPNGSVPEVLEAGKTGFICRTVSEAVEAVDRISEISREQCRREFETRFSARRMAQDYVRLYERVINDRFINDSRRAKDEHGRDHSRPGKVLHPRDLLTG
ncbi:MAG TPA: glycosyltransferase family 4 protein [Candidatus Krumholzibacteria bacterium]